MRIIECLFAIGFVSMVACKENKTSIPVSEVLQSFAQQLHQKDSTVVLDSFYLVGIDTMTFKSTLIHQRFPYLHLLARMEKEYDSIRNLVANAGPTSQDKNIGSQKQIEEERKFVADEIDSINHLLLTADSIKPTGYRILFKVVVSKKDQFSISDTISYSLSPQWKLSDWDRNVEKDIDSLASGKHVMRAGYNIK